MSYPILTSPADDKERLMADVVRVLSLASGKLWEAELYGEVGAFRQTLDRSSDFSTKDLSNAMKALESSRMITAEKRISATSGERRPDVLVGLITTEPLQKLLVLDPDIRKYREISSSLT